MSANSIVTVLRSPSTFSGADASVTRTRAGADCLSLVDASFPRAGPNFLQNFEPYGFRTAHDGHLSSSLVPHSAQKIASARFSIFAFCAQHLGSRTQLIEQCLGVLQVGGVEALSEPAV